MRDTRFSARSALLFAAAILAIPAFAQTITTGDVAGTIKDASGAVVPSATITLKSPDTGETRSMITGASGDYRFTLLKPGQYSISAQATGLKSNVQNFTVQVAKRRRWT